MYVGQLFQHSYLLTLTKTVLYRCVIQCSDTGDTISKSIPGLRIKCKFISGLLFNKGKLFLGRDRLFCIVVPFSVSIQAIQKLTKFQKGISL